VNTIVVCFLVVEHGGSSPENFPQMPKIVFSLEFDSNKNGQSKNGGGHVPGVPLWVSRGAAVAQVAQACLL
jgi:hypothetical protein